MNEFCTTEEIIERIKDILSKHINGKVYDWHVADVLRIDYKNLASMKARNRIPYKEVLLFCDRTGIQNPLNIFLKKKNC